MIPWMFAITAAFFLLDAGEQSYVSQSTPGAAALGMACLFAILAVAAYLMRKWATP
jgi:hypothetical protein